jgi:iron complex outermembrane receptor protein
VRGLGPDFTRVRINGMEAQASTDGYSGANRGRGFDFNVFASELFNRIDVRKTPSADVEEGSLGATVDLTTGHPFDYKGFKLAASAQAGYNDQTEKTRPRMALLVSNTFADDKLGALFSVAYSKTAVTSSSPARVCGTRATATAAGAGPPPAPAASATCRRPTSPTPTSVYNLASAPDDLLSALHALRAGPGEDRAPGPDRIAAVGAGRRHQDHAGRPVLALQGQPDDWPLEAIGFSRGASQGGKPEMVVRDMILDSNNTMSTACSTMSTCARSTIATSSRPTSASGP